LRWVKTTMNPEIIDRALNPMGDWLRYNGTSWLFFTDQSATYVREVLKKNFGYRGQYYDRASGSNRL